MSGSCRDRRATAALVQIIALTLVALTANAQEEDPRAAGLLRDERGAVTYVTSTSVYGDLGRNNGLREGDTVFVSNPSGQIGRLRVTHLASKSFSAEIIDKTGIIVQGNALLAKVRSLAVQPPSLPKSDSTIVAVPPRGNPPLQPSVAAGPGRESRETRPTQLRGRLALQYYAMHSSAAGDGLIFSQPAAVLSLTADRLFSLPLQFNYYSNHRYDARGDAARSGTGQDRMRNRFYQLSLQYGGDGEPYTAVLGRFVPYQVGGIGTVDGIMLAGRRGAFEAGLIAGSQPGYRDSEISLKDQKIAIYGGYTGGGEAWQLRSNLAFSQTYSDGAVDRGYFYLVNAIALGGTLTLYQNASVDLYDADDGSGHLQPHMTDFYTSATWRPARMFSLTGSFADRRSVYFLRSFSLLPDSLFNASRLRNYQISAGMNIAAGMYASVTASLRTQENADKAATAYSARYTWADFLSSRVNVYLLGSYADNLFNTSRSLGFECNRDIVDGLYTAVRLQHYRYVYTQNNRALDRISIATDVYYRLSSIWYLSLNYERYWEEGAASDRIYSEVTARLR